MNHVANALAIARRFQQQLAAASAPDPGLRLEAAIAHQRIRTIAMDVDCPDVRALRDVLWGVYSAIPSGLVEDPATAAAHLRYAIEDAAAVAGLDGEPDAAPASVDDECWRSPRWFGGVVGALNHEKLRGARRRGKIEARGKGEAREYSARSVANYWPEHAEAIRLAIEDVDAMRIRRT